MAGDQNRDGQQLESSKKKVVGEPDEEKPQVRFNVAGDGNQDMVKVMRHSQKKWRETGLPHLSPRRHSLTLPGDSGLPLVGRHSARNGAIIKVASRQSRRCR